MISFVRAFTVAKRDDAANEDRYARSLDGRACAISDGASVSFDSGPWAELLAQGFVNGASFTAAWIKSAAITYKAAYNRDALDWMQQGALDRGSFASLLGVRPAQVPGSIEVVVVGDSVLAIIDAGELQHTMPYSRPEQFDASPQLISTSAAENEPIFREVEKIQTQVIDLTPYSSPCLLLVTDALGHWLVSYPNRAHELTTKLSDQEFEEFVVSERQAGRLRRDDTTLLIMDCDVSPISH
ncbi:hypothetical protein [Brevundimonas subvibrioides]|uniref:hypothetical protein n=1 Tax=Brevundimonas subvibrioides TaxID=74313 RepID=UPI0022B5B0E9|nr:hypothetical protein [Brevundimonas subvibrioides]